MTSSDNKAKSNYLIDYQGMLNTVPDAQIKQFMAQEDGLVNEDFAAKVNRIADSQIEPDFVVPGKAGALIARCTAADAEKIYDTVFGMGTARRQAPKMVQVQDQDFDKGNLRTMMINAFGNAASGLRLQYAKPLSPAFAAAAAPVADIVRPDFTVRPVAPMLMAA